jgi:hypothetical protein
MRVEISVETGAGVGAMEAGSPFGDDVHPRRKEKRKRVKGRRFKVEGRMMTFDL